MVPCSTGHQGRSEQPLDQSRNMTYHQNERSCRRAEYKEEEEEEEEEEIQRGWNVCSEQAPCQVLQEDGGAPHRVPLRRNARSCHHVLVTSFAPATLCLVSLKCTEPTHWHTWTVLALKLQLVVLAVAGRGRDLTRLF